MTKDGFKVQLVCELTETSDLPRRGSATPVPLWTSERKVLMQELKMGPEGVSIPVSFSIPPGAEETDLWWSSQDRRINWMLLAFSGRKGAQYLNQFNVPIFKARAKM